jgi:hypothetical protein
MSDILERLREAASGGDVFVSLGQAADEIEKLRAERRAMQGALLAIKAHTQDAHPMSYMDQLCRIARAALGEKE